MNITKLLKTWSLPDRTAERTQITLRLDFDLYAKLHALKEVYKTRSVNDMINDILKAGLDEIVETLPSYTVQNDATTAFYLAGQSGGVADDYQESIEGPKVIFDYAYRRILETKAVDETEAKKVEVVS